MSWVSSVDEATATEAAVEEQARRITSIVSRGKSVSERPGRCSGWNKSGVSSGKRGTAAIYTNRVAGDKSILTPRRVLGPFRVNTPTLLIAVVSLCLVNGIDGLCIGPATTNMMKTRSLARSGLLTERRGLGFSSARIGLSDASRRRHSSVLSCCNLNRYSSADDANGRAARFAGFVHTTRNEEWSTVRRLGRTRLFSQSAQQKYEGLLHVDEHESPSTIAVGSKPESSSTASPSPPSSPPSPPSPSTDEPTVIEARSKPKKGGNWNPSAPLQWSQNFGRRSPAEDVRLAALANLSPDDEGYFPVDDTRVPGITIVRTREEAKIVLQRLFRPDAMEVFHACDTEVMQIELKKVGPVGNGYVTCVSMYAGPDFDYGLGDGPGSTLWIDNLDDAYDVLQEFKDWFQDDRFQKVWHNVGFDRHVMWNEGIDVLGFGGDTMHMARLQDTSRAKFGVGTGYSLEALTADILGSRKRPMKEIFGVKRLRKDGSEGSLVDLPPVEVLQRDPKFRPKWIVYSAFDAESTWRLRERLQEMLEDMPWFDDHNLYHYYQMHMRKFGEVLTDMERRGVQVDAHTYLKNVEIQARKDRKYHVKTFREWAAKQIGPDGYAMNLSSSTQLGTFLFGGCANAKTHEVTEDVRVFKVLREDISEEALQLMEQRDQQQQQQNHEQDGTEPQRQPDEFDDMKVAQLKMLLKDLGLKVSGNKPALQERLRGHYLTTSNDGDNEDDASATPKINDDFDSMNDDDLRDACVTRGINDSGNRKALLQRLRGDSAFTLELLSASSDRSADGYKTISDALKAAASQEGSSGSVLRDILDDVKIQSNQKKKNVDITVRSVEMKPTKFTAGGAPSATADVLRGLAGDPFADPPKYGTAYDHFGGAAEGHDACVALYSLTTIGSIDTMIANFITSLQTLADHDSRVHCSMNLNTETGRLSARRPNLQNQPALEKDTYQIRKAFQAREGNRLIVADYGQLELRLLASMTNCKSMIEAFEAGGDFHSRTALGMFDYIQKKVEDGDCLLEWDYSNGEPPKPMLKDEFASERRKAKTLNFSIAYGKTAHGLSKDWGVSTEEAQGMLQAWYDSRPEVEKWQKETKKTVRKIGVTRTLMGRYRQLPEAMSGNKKLVGHAERASINTPIQGGAADVAMMAMNLINENELLKKLGWILMLQVHDEVILEGPEETSEEAFEEVIKCMQQPWTFGLSETKVPLLVDGSCEQNNWYDAK